MASKQFDDLLAMLTARPANEPMELADRRKLVKKTAALFRLPEGVESNDVDADGVPAQWLAPHGASTDAAILYLHGGGYCLGDISTHRHLAAMIAKEARTPALIVDYRLAPEHPFPAAVDDAVAAYSWLLNQNAIPPERVVVAGDSAGGGLTVSLMLAARDHSMPQPAGGVLLSPWTDLAGTGESLRTREAIDPVVKPNDVAALAQWYLGGADPTHPHASPLYGDLKGLPPLFIHVGTAETLHDDAVRLADLAKSQGVSVDLDVWDDMIHVWHFYAQLIPEGEEAIRHTAQFIRQRLHATAK